MQQQIYERLCGLEELSQLLGQYQKKPAIFIQRVPEEAKDQIFPRIVCRVKENINMEYDFLGELELCIQEQISEVSKLDSICKVLREKLEYCFLADDEQLICTRYGMTEDPLQMESEIFQTRVCKFQMMKFEEGELMHLSPVTTLNQWIQDTFPEIKIVTKASVENEWQAGAEYPAVYIRLETIKPGLHPDNWQAVWVQAGIRIFVMTDYAKKISLIQSISEKLLRKEKLQMSDGGTLLIQKAEYNDTMNPLKNRQFFVECQYGILREEEPAKPLQGMQIEFERQKDVR